MRRLLPMEFTFDPLKTDGCIVSDAFSTLPHDQLTCNSSRICCFCVVPSSAVPDDDTTLYCFLRLLIKSISVLFESSLLKKSIPSTSKSVSPNGCVRTCWASAEVSVPSKTAPVDWLLVNSVFLKGGRLCGGSVSRLSLANTYCLVTSNDGLLGSSWDTIRTASGTSWRTAPAIFSLH